MKDIYYIIRSQILGEEDEEIKSINRINSLKMNKKEKILSNIKESNNEKYNSDISPRKENQLDLFKQKNSTKKFLLSINETIIGATKIGYIFKFETPKKKLTRNYSILNSTYFFN